jgi:aryl-alcohol dehydrogenase-like predicted oxidoreductase
MGEVRYRRLGESGLMVSVVGLGCNNFGSRVDAEGSRAVVQAALEAGITLFDTADSYGDRGRSEEFLGAALKRHRDEVVIATKFGADMAGGNGPDWGARGGRRLAALRRRARHPERPHPPLTRPARVRHRSRR